MRGPGTCLGSLWLVFIELVTGTWGTGANWTRDWRRIESGESGHIWSPLRLALVHVLLSSASWSASLVLAP